MVTRGNRLHEHTSDEASCVLAYIFTANFYDGSSDVRKMTLTRRPRSKSSKALLSPSKSFSSHTENARWGENRPNIALTRNPLAMRLTKSLPSRHHGRRVGSDCSTRTLKNICDNKCTIGLLHAKLENEAPQE